MARIPYADVQGMVEEEAARFGVDPSIVRGIIAAENSGSPETAAKFSTVMPGAVSRANARGIMQVTPVGLKEAQNRGLIPSDWKHEDLSTDIRKGVTAGVAYLKYLTGLSSNPLEIAAMYNAGPTGGRRKVLPAETQLYNRKFAAATGLPMDNNPAQIGAATGDDYYTAVPQGTPTATGQPAGSNINDMVTSLLGSLATSNDTIGGIVEMLQGNTKRNQALMTQNAQQAQGVAIAAGALAGQKAEIDFRVQSVQQQTQALLGMNPEEAENELTRSTAALTAAQTQRAAVRQEYDQLSQVDLLTNPLGYIFAQLKLPSIAARHDNLVAAEKSAVDNISTRLGVIKAANSTLTANTAAAAKEIQLKAADLSVQQAQIKLREQEIANNSAMAGQALQIAQLTDKMGDNRRQAIQLQIQQANHEESQRVRKEEFEIRMEQLTAARADREKKQATDAALSTGLQRVSQLLGMPVAMTIEDFDKLQGATKMAWAAATVNSALGPDLHGAVETLRMIGGNPGAIQSQNPGFGTLLQKLDASRNEYITAARRPGPTGKAPSAKEADKLGSENYENMLESSMKDRKAAANLTAPNWDRTFNPYKAEHEVMLDKVKNGEFPELQNNIYVRTLRNIVGEKGENLKDGIVSGEQADRAFRAIAENIKAGQIAPAAAAKQIVEYHKLAAARNLKFYQYNLMGLPMQSHYMVAMKPAGKVWGTGDPLPVDLFNTTQTENALTRMVLDSTIQSADLLKARNLMTPSGAAAGFAAEKLKGLFSAPQ